MDTDKFFKDLVDAENIQDIPLEFICRVTIVVLELLNSNKYLYKIGE